MNKYKKYTSIALLLFGMCWVARCATELPTATATVRVVDDAGLPVADAKTFMAFEVPYDLITRKYTKKHEGISDSEGRFKASNESVGFMYYGAKKEGYYDFEPTRYDYQGLNALKTTWQPGNLELTAVLKKIINPVPMYARKVSLQIPELEKNIGYDFQTGDWVVPYGKGLHSDLFFYATKRWAGYQDFESKVIISFSSSYDGIQEIKKTIASQSRLVSPQFAPEDGYAGQWIHERWQTAGKGRKGLDVWDSDYKDYIFRVRTQVDENGKIKAANYGKIMREIIVGGEAGERMWAEFTYYYNPDPHSRSLEFDLKRNLAKDAGRDIYLP